MFKAIDSVGEAAVLRKTAHPHESKEYRHRPTSSSMSGLMPIAVLIDELKHEDVVVRMNSFQKIDVIAKGLGADRTRNEFIPFLSAFLEEEDEDVLVILAGKLPKLVPVIGGISAAEPVLNLLKGLCVVDENVVYEAAVESIVEIAKLDSEKSIQTFIYNLIVKLIESGLSNAKRAVCALIPALCPMLQDDAQRNLVVFFAKACSNESPIVRRVACTNLPKLIKVLPRELVHDHLLQPFRQLAVDDQDSVRLLAVLVCIEIAYALEPETRKSIVIPVIQNLCADSCWRVRYMAADKFFDLCKCQIDNLDVNFMLELFVKRLQDAESEVRNIASSHVADFCEFLTREQIILRILPIIQGIASDKSQFTRGSLASNVMVICRYISKEDVQSYLVPLFLKLLKDEFHEVRLNIISKLEAVAHSIGLDQLSATLMPAILDLASDRKWRVRIAILQHIPLIAKELGVQFFDQNLSNICMNWLVDEVFSIREAAVKNLSNIVQIFGVNWAISSIIPKVKEMTSNSNYLHRITCLYAASEFAQTMKSRELIEEMLPMILLMSSDPVPNIRFNVCKTLESILKEKLLSADMLSSKIEPILSSLSHEDDPDVQYYAQRALKYTR